MKKNMNNSPLEYHEAVALATYLDLLKRTGKILLYSHIPHETFTKSWGAKMRNKYSGVMSGVPDYVIVTAKKVIFLELKRVKGGKVSDEQKEWLEHLQDKTSVSMVCHGIDESMAMLKGVI